MSASSARSAPGTLGRVSKQGRVAVVTGAARGLGRAFAQRLAVDGATVIGVDRTPMPALAQEWRDLGGEASEFQQCDLTDPAQVRAFAQAVLSAHSRCDILVNNAGLAAHHSFLEVTLADWRALMSVNVESMVLLCQAFAPAMMAHRYGRIVNITSNTVGLVAQGLVPYITSKAAVVGLTRALATEFGSHGITVNCVAPGLTRTEHTESAFPDGAAFEHFAQAQAIKRPELPQDLVGAVSFLGSDDAAFITGQTLIVDGGLLRVQ